MAESLVSHGINTSLIIRRDQILSNFDKDISLSVQNYIKTKGVQVLDEDIIIDFEADVDCNVTNVITKEQPIPAEFILLALATNTTPNVQLAKRTGIEIGQTKAIHVSLSVFK
ncbi:pyridine nucleotide-disulphide oxidoreductase [Candidatus Scalindua japonica]|uniref:Pyridine nucleotide-disulphide oxidoreductase n=2 Tax=Candidatus Scalindua japonica TaxID=1284222 RepID=A0A286TVF3_9BACT|nr:pyridine nucleotide-disulphide oxidoreductase [Candidatus Scalindua japonica]